MADPLTKKEVGRRQYLSRKVEVHGATEEECTELIRILDKEGELARDDWLVGVAVSILRSLAWAERALLQVKREAPDAKWERRIITDSDLTYPMWSGPVGLWNHVLSVAQGDGALLRRSRLVLEIPRDIAPTLRNLLPLNDEERRAFKLGERVVEDLEDELTAPVPEVKEFVAVEDLKKLKVSATATIEPRRRLKEGDEIDLPHVPAKIVVEPALIRKFLPADEVKEP